MSVNKPGNMDDSYDKWVKGKKENPKEVKYDSDGLGRELSGKKEQRVIYAGPRIEKSEKEETKDEPSEYNVIYAGPRMKSSPEGEE
jgi:hypothetical protein